MTMLLLIGLGCVLLLLAFLGMLGFVIRCCVAIALSAVLVRCFPSLSHQIFASGQVAVTWLFFVTIALVWFSYKIVK
jgi:hypothetical protein